MSTPANFNGPDAAAVAPVLQQTLASHQETPPHRKELSATSLLIIANTLIFYAMLVYSACIMGKAFGDTIIFDDYDSALLRAWGSNIGPLTLTGQFWRVITSIFLHWNFIHLGGNMLFLWGFGRYLDRFFTRAQAFAIYLLTGAAGSIFSLAWHPMENACGASGAIYGQIGVLIALLCFARLNLPRRDIRNLLLWIFFSMPIGLLWGHISKRTDYAAHVGGILSGFVIGLMLAPSFRPRMERVGRQYGVLRFAAMVLVVLFAIVMQVRRNAILGVALLDYLRDLPSAKPPTRQLRVTRVFLDLKGDPGLVRHFTGFLNTELEKAGIAVVGTEHDADGVLRGELNSQIEHVNLRMGMVKMHINGQRGLQTVDSCESLSTGDNSNLYERSAASTVSEIRDRYHDARTVHLDPASDLAASQQFAAEFPSELKTSGLTLVQSGPADIALRIDLLTQKIPVEEDEVIYHITAVAPDGAPLFESSGTGVMSARLVGAAPAACPQRLADLEWIYTSNTLASIAHKIANDLYAP